jgi:hypothetical protein
MKKKQSEQQPTSAEAQAKRQSWWREYLIS